MNIVTITCRLCDKAYSFSVQPGDMAKWNSGSGYVQEIFPYLTADQRELLVSKVCGPCFDDLFGSYEDEDVPEHDPGAAPDECDWHWKHGAPPIVKLVDGVCPLDHEHEWGR